MSLGGLLGGGGAGGIGGMLGGMFGGPLGAMIGQMVEKIVGQVLNQVMDQMGKELGMSDSTQDSAKKAISDRTGNDGCGKSIKEMLNDFKKETNASDSDMGEVERKIDDLKQKVMDGFKELSETNNKNGKKKSEGASGEGGQDWFIAVATALAEAAGDQANKIADKSTELTNARDAAKGMDAKDPKKGESDANIMQLQTELQAESSKMGFLMQAVNASINSLGEALKTAAQVK
jgi:hypothetical protein